MTLERMENLPYRNNISCIVFKDKRFLLVQLTGWPKDWWKFPQGGVKEGESEKTAVQRELKEELGSQNFRIVATSSHTHQYNWSVDSIKKAGYRWRGQIQKFFLVEFLGNEEEIEINRKETQQYKWVELKDLFRNIDHDHPLFANYKNTIEKVLREFKMLQNNKIHKL